MSRPDFLGINDHKLFKQLSKTLSASSNKTLNIIAERHNVLYAWNKEDNSVLTLNMKAARENEESAVNYQTLLPHSPPYFAPEKLVVNETNSILIAAGPNGILVFEIPERSPPCGNFYNNKEVIYCRTYNLLENILSFSSTVEVRQVRFHPGSPTDSHFVVLTSDNIIRLFSLSDSTVSEVGTYSLGPKPTSKIPDRNLSFLDALGDLAVDFDFSSPTVETSNLVPQVGSSCSGRGDGIEAECEDEEDEELLWPVFILYGNGLVCKMMVKYAGENSHPGLYGPLNFHNFPTGNLSDFCSILCIPTTPPVIAIAHCDGNLFHGLELPCDDEEENQECEDHKQTYSKPPMTQLYLVEVIEIELGLGIASSNVEEQNYTCPIFLERDLSTCGSYFATHNTGVHHVYIHAVEELNQFVNKDDDEPPPEGIFTTPSTAEYIICTRPSPSEKLNPVMGISIVSEPHALITVLANGNVLTLPVKDELRTVLSVVDKSVDQLEGQLGQNLNLSSSVINQNTPFDVYISDILKKSTSQPILQADTNDAEPSEEVCYEIMERACKIFREEHFVNLTKAREEIEKRSKQLKVLQEFQVSELNNMQKERETFQISAESIAAKYEELKEKQEEISKRCQMLLVLLSRQQTEPSIAEEKYFDKLKTYDKQIDGYIVAIEKLKDKMKYQRNQMINWRRENQRPDPLLPGQSEVIRQNLGDTTKKIAEIAAEVKQYMKKLNIN